MRTGGNANDPWNEEDGFQLFGERRVGFPLLVDGARIETTIELADGNMIVHVPELDFVSRLELEWSDEYDRLLAPDLDAELINGDGSVFVLRQGRQTLLAPYDPFAVDLEHLDEGGLVKAPMHGKLIAVFVKPGDRVAKGQRLAILEAMKMEHALLAAAEGEVAEVAAASGTQVAEGARLIVIHPDEEA
jgi:3-methylcrotonyl-CoA carboxylase alpha subunit